MFFRRQIRGRHPVPLLHRRQDLLLIRQGLARIVSTLHVGAQEAGEVDHVAPSLENRLLRVRATDIPHAQAHAPPTGIPHLGGHGALPDQLVDLRLVLAELLANLLDGCDTVPRRADGLVRLLGVADLVLISTRLLGDELVAVLGRDLLARHVDGHLAQGNRVGPHVGDVPVLIQALGSPHSALGIKTQFAVALLLQRRGVERWRGFLREGFFLRRQDLERLTLDRLDERLGLRPIEQCHVIALQLAGVGIEVLARRDALPPETHEVGLEHFVGGSLEGGHQVPVLGLAETYARLFSLHQQPYRHGLHAPGRQLRLDLTPQHGGNSVPVEAIDNAPRLLRLNHVRINVAGIVQRLQDRHLGDLVKHHAPHRALGLQNLHQVPGDGLSLAVFIGRQQQGVTSLELGLELLDARPGIGLDHIQRLKVFLHVDRQAGPLQLLVLGGHLGCFPRQVADMTHAGLHHIVGTQVLPQGLGLGG